MRADISFADALRAASALSPLDDEARNGLLDMLGLTRPTSTPALSATGVWQPSSTEIATRPAAQAVVIEPRVEVPAREDRAPAKAHNKSRRTLVTRFVPEQDEAALPTWLLVPGERLEPPTPIGAAASPTPPLFSPLQERAILTAALSTIAFEGDIDVDGVIDVLARGQPLQQVPRLAVPTLRRGVQVLVDTSAALDPYRSDIHQLLVSFDAVLADDRLQTQSFCGCPGRGVLMTGGALTAWSPPPAGTLVAIVSDFGIGGPLIDDDHASASEWLEFINRVRRSGHAAIGFVPYEARRWPPLIARALMLLHWSERTTVGEIRRATRETRRP